MIEFRLSAVRWVAVRIGFLAIAAGVSARAIGCPYSSVGPEHLPENLKQARTPEAKSLLGEPVVTYVDPVSGKFISRRQFESKEGRVRVTARFNRPLILPGGKTVTVEIIVTQEQTNGVGEGPNISVEMRDDRTGSVIPIKLDPSQVSPNTFGRAYYAIRGRDPVTRSPLEISILQPFASNGFTFSQSGGWVTVREAGASLTEPGARAIQIHADATNPPGSRPVVGRVDVRGGVNARDIGRPD